MFSTMSPTGERARLKLWWDRRRPAPVDVLAPVMQWGRFRTWANAFLKRSELGQARAEAWKIYVRLLMPRLRGTPFKPSDRLGRFAHHIVHSGLRMPIRYLEIGAFEGNSIAFVYVLLWYA